MIKTLEIDTAVEKASWLTKMQEARLTKVTTHNRTSNIIAVNRISHGHMQIDANYVNHRGRKIKSRRMLYDLKGDWYTTYYFTDLNCTGRMEEQKK